MSNNAATRAISFPPRTILIICGPTATGKSALAVELARILDGEIISADSRQVYRGLDLGSGKITTREMKGIPHHLLDVASPQGRKKYTAATFQRDANRAIHDILKRGKLPIICGGTGFYIQSVVDQTVFPTVPPQPALRKRLSRLDAPALFSRLTKLDPTRAATIDRHNPVRLVRAIEIATVMKKGAPGTKKNSLIPSIPYTPIWIGLDYPDDVLKERIKARLTARLRRGMIAEVRRLRASGLSWKRLHEFGLEYRYIALFLRGHITRQEMIERLEMEIWHLVKRQRTWFRKNPNVRWI